MDQAPLEQDGGFQMPPLEDLLKALEGMDSLSEEKKQELKENLLARADRAKSSMFSEPMETVEKSGIAPDLLILFLLVAVIILIFVFFGYKLYKSLAERERRKEEKRRQKQQKKKK